MKTELDFPLTFHSIFTQFLLLSTHLRPWLQSEFTQLRAANEPGTEAAVSKLEQDLSKVSDT